MKTVYINRRLTLSVWLLALYCCPVFGQIITNADGSALITQYCYADHNFEFKGIPAGGTFSGCGMYQQNGRWFFNPVTATQSVTVFPYQCTITYTTLNNQSLNRSVLIQKPVKIDPPLEDSGTCNGEFLLHATTLYAGAYDYLWSPAAPLYRPDTNTTEGVIDQTTTFVLLATDRTSGCMGSDTLTITRYPKPVVSITPDMISIRSRDSVALAANGATYYQWFPSRWLSNDTVANPFAYPRAPVSYSVVGLNEFGCTDTAQMHININEAMFVPNVFSPNGDGLNDAFKIENIGYQGIIEFKIYNRWGQIIFQTLDGTKGWDGTYNGITAETGIYYYMIKLGMSDGMVKLFQGDVTLIR